MDQIDVLFDNRSVIGARLEGLLADRGFTKMSFCKECGISRPTLNKILDGTIGSLTHYEKHMRKILDCLSITPDVLLGNVSQAHSRTRQFRSLLHIKKEDIAAAIEMSIKRIEEIEAGAPMTNAELRDLAMYLGVSTHCFLAENAFFPQTTALSALVGELNDSDAELSGFWGHLGIMPSNSTEYIWYPITSYEESELAYSLKGERAIVPCMDNKLLYLNLAKIKSIVLLDDACDAPGYYNWDTSVGEGEVPLVVYEVVEDYLYDRPVSLGTVLDDNGDDAEAGGASDEEYSPNLRRILDKLIEEKGWTEEVVHKMVSGIRIRYADGSVSDNDIDVEVMDDVGTDLVEAVNDLYMAGGLGKAERFVSFVDSNGAVTVVNTDEVAVIEMPLVKVEGEIMGGLRGVNFS